MVVDLTKAQEDFVLEEARERSKEFNLSDKATGYKNRNKFIGEMYLEQDVKEFIKRLKAELCYSLDSGIDKEVWFREFFNKLAGDKLI